MSTTFDLDALEQEGRPGPLTFTVKGREFTLTDPLLLDWTVYEALDWDDNRAVLRTLLSADDYEAFMALKLSAHAMNILSDRLGKHYLVGEAEGSPAS